MGFFALLRVNDWLGASAPSQTVPTMRNINEINDLQGIT
jgi:hypothetical protein